MSAFANPMTKSASELGTTRVVTWTVFFILTIIDMATPWIKTSIAGSNFVGFNARGGALAMIIFAFLQALYAWIVILVLQYAPSNIPAEHEGKVKTSMLVSALMYFVWVMLAWCIWAGQFSSVVGASTTLAENKYGAGFILTIITWLLTPWLLLVEWAAHKDNGGDGPTPSSPTAATGGEEQV